MTQSQGVAQTTCTLWACRRRVSPDSLYLVCGRCRFWLIKMLGGHTFIQIMERYYRRRGEGARKKYRHMAKADSEQVPLACEEGVPAFPRRDLLRGLPGGMSEAEEEDAPDIAS